MLGDKHESGYYNWCFYLDSAFKRADPWSLAILPYSPQCVNVTNKIKELRVTSYYPFTSPKKFGCQYFSDLAFAKKYFTTVSGVAFLSIIPEINLVFQLYRIQVELILVRD